MCTGLEIGLLAASTGASIGGSMLSRNEAQDNANAVAAAKNAVLQANLKKQRAYSDENVRNLEPVIAGFDPATQAAGLQTAQDQRVADTTANLKAPTSADVDSIPLQEGGPAIVKSQIAQRMLDAFNKSSDLAEARAKFAGYGDTAANNGIAIQAGGRNIDTVNDFAKTEASLLPSEQELAGFSAQKTPSGLGPLLSGVGQLGAMYAGAGAPGFGKFTSLFSGGSPFGVLPGGLPLGQGGIGHA